MKVIKLLIIISVVGFVISCTLDRSNPLDPDGNDIEVPLKVTGLSIPEYSYQSVTLTWDA